MNEHDDTYYVQQCLAGHSEAFEILVDKYQRTIFNVAYRMTNNYDDAEEITQTVFVKTYERLDTYNSNYKFYSWIYRIAMNETLNYIHQKKRTHELHSGVTSSEKNPAEVYQDTELGEIIQQALLDLSEEYQILIILKHFQNFSYKEISEILKIPEKRVKSRLFTARRLLKEALAHKGLILNE